MTKVDFHMHTLCSDGTYTVEQLIDRVKRENITHFSITDHDTIAGISIAKAYNKDNLDYKTGVEITCKDYQYKNASKPFSVHLLGYDFDEKNEALLKLLRDRNKRNDEMFQNLIDDLCLAGYPIKINEISKSCGNILQLIDVIRFINVLYPSVSIEISEMIHAYAPKLASVNIPVEEGIAAIKVAGGKAVWAHPFSGYNCLQKETMSRKDVLAILYDLKDFGIDGLEAEYLAFTLPDRAWLHETARSEGLFCTAGSDFHGFKGRDQMGIIYNSFCEM